MRAYFFGNFYLSSIQQGIQAAHCLAEMWAKYSYFTSEYELLKQWALEHKTLIIVNGGHSDDLRILANIIEKICTEHDLPWATFSEDEMSLNNALTCVGVIVDDRHVNFMETEKTYSDERDFVSFDLRVGLTERFHISQNELVLLDLIKSKSLAR